MQENEQNKIEDVKRRLYDPNNHTTSHQMEGVLHQMNHVVSEEWKDSQTKKDEGMNNRLKKPKLSPFKKFFIVSLVFFVGALGFAFYKFSSNNISVSNEKIDIKIIGNAFAKGGDELPLQIEITNTNNASLVLSNLIVEYPKGAEDNITDVVRLPHDPIGTIKPGEVVIRNIKVKLFGAEKSIRNIKVSLEYHPDGSNAIFTKDKYYPVTISMAPISLDIEAPTEVISNQPISFKIKATLNTSLPDSNPVLQVSYPNNFTFESAIPTPVVNNSVWDLSNLSITEPLIIEIKGNINGQDGDEQIFHVYAGTTDGMNQSAVNVVYSSILQKVVITKPFLEARILVDGQEEKEYAVSGGSVVNAEIAWANNLSTRITDGQIIVNLSGNVFDKTTVNSDAGYYDSANNQIIWDKNSISDFADINPGDKGSVSFSFKPLSLIGNSSIKNPQISVKVSIKGREPLLGSTYNDINNFSEKMIKILSDFQIVPSASYFSGNIPPKAETETKYTINWTLSNSANTINQAEAHTTLPIYVKWVGLTSGEKENVSYNDISREVTWLIGQVSPNTGINSNREASFIVSINPSISQIGSVPQLIKETYLSGLDSFTNTNIKNTRSPVTTSLYGDENAKIGNNGRVVQ